MAKSFLQSVLETILGNSTQLNLSGNEASPHAVLSHDLTLLGKLEPASTITALAVVEEPAIKKDLSKEVDKSGSGISVIDLGGTGAYSNLLRKQNIQLYRNYAKYSTWVRAAIDYHRRMLGRAAYELTPIDTTAKPSRRDKQVKAEIEKLWRQANEAEESYGMLKEQMIEDYLVVGHGCLELDLNRDLTVRGMHILDAARVGFVKGWDGTDRTVPRFCLFKDSSGSTVERRLAHEQMFCLVNRPLSDTKLGFSHVEALNRTILALLSGDEFLIKQLIQPIPDSLLNLGEGVNKQQVDEFKYQIQQVRDKLAIIGGSKTAQVLRLSGTAEEMKILDGQEWYVRQVAAIFGISTAKLKLAVDTSRANTESMYEDDLEMITGELTRIEELETSTFVNRYSYQGEINLEFTYPIMQRKDEQQQATIAKTQTGQAWAGINEARLRTGEKPLDVNQFPYADEPIINMGKGSPPLPFSVWVKTVQEFEKNIGKKKPASSPDPEPEETDVDETEATDDDSPQ